MKNELVGATGFEPANLLHPMQARYQAAPRPEFAASIRRRVASAPFRVRTDSEIEFWALTSRERASQRERHYSTATRAFAWTA